MTSETSPLLTPAQGPSVSTLVPDDGRWRNSTSTSTPVSAEQRACDFLGVDQRRQLVNYAASGSCEERDSSIRQPLLLEGSLLNDKVVSPTPTSTRGTLGSVESTQWAGVNSSKNTASCRAKKTKAYQAAVIAKQKYEKSGVILREFSEEEIERRYQDWYDHEYKQGVPATFAASVIWIVFAANWVVAFGGQSDGMLEKLLPIHLVSPFTLHSPPSTPLYPHLPPIYLHLLPCIPPVPTVHLHVPLFQTLSAVHLCEYILIQKRSDWAMCGQGVLTP